MEKYNRFRLILTTLGLAFIIFLNASLVIPGVISSVWEKNGETGERKLIIYKTANIEEETSQVWFSGKEISVIKSTCYFEKVIFTDSNGQIYEGFLYEDDAKVLAEAGIKLKKASGYFVDCTDQKQRSSSNPNSTLNQKFRTKPNKVNDPLNTGTQTLGIPKAPLKLGPPSEDSIPKMPIEVREKFEQENLRKWKNALEKHEKKNKEGNHPNPDETQGIDIG